MNKAVKHFFDTQKESNDCFQSSDGFVFFKEHDATAHARTLKDSKVTPHKREDFTIIIEHEITAEDLEQNTELKEAGAHVGEVIGLPVDGEPGEPGEGEGESGEGESSEGEPGEGEGEPGEPGEGTMDAHQLADHAEAAGELPLKPIKKSRVKKSDNTTTT